MDRDEIAAEIALGDLVRRPSDGAHSPSDQLRLRARKPDYQHLFECSDTACSRIRLRSGSTRARSASRSRRAGAAGRTGKAEAKARSLPREPDPVRSDLSWYETLRAGQRPARLRVLLIAETPPDPGAGARRFFYSPELTVDNLYRGVAQALYGERGDIDVADKPAVLERIRTDGLWLIDAVEQPVNKRTDDARARAIRAGVPASCGAAVNSLPSSA